MIMYLCPGIIYYRNDHVPVSGITYYRNDHVPVSGIIYYRNDHVPVSVIIYYRNDHVPVSGIIYYRNDHVPVSGIIYYRNDHVPVSGIIYYSMYLCLGIYFIGMNSIVLYLCHGMLRGRFPIMWKTEYQHLPSLIKALWGSAFWMIIAYIMYKKKVFITF